MKHRIIPAIMSGGSGTRLWPASTDALPKQFHALIGARSLFVETVRRVAGDVGELSFAPPIILGNARHEALIDAHLAEAGMEAAAIALEPIGRNTAATGALAAALGAEIDSAALVLLLPADHVIADPAAFHAAILRAALFAHERIVTFGIDPDRPATGYGYIKRGASLGDGVDEIALFKEKPLEPVARAYLAEGGYAWNAGMFLFSPRVMLAEFAAAPDIRDATLAALTGARRDANKIRLDEPAFAQIRSEPLDIAVMQETKLGAVAHCDIGWADIGAWDEVLRLSETDAQGNAVSGPVVILDGANNLLRSDGPKLCVAGVEGLIIVATKDAVIVVPRERAQDVKKLLEQAKKLD